MMQGWGSGAWGKRVTDYYMTIRRCYKRLFSATPAPLDQTAGPSTIFQIMAVWNLVAVWNLSGIWSALEFRRSGVLAHLQEIDNTSALLFTVSVKNITVSVDNKTYHRARVRAAERRTSLSAIVRGILTELATEETAAERLKRQEDEIIVRLQQRRAGFSAANRLTRDEIHDRHALR